MSTGSYTVERYDNERDWLKARLNGIGGSESAAVVRLSRFCGPFGLYWRKREGRAEGDDNAMAEMKDAGHRHERTIAEWFMEQPDQGMKLMRDPGDFTIFRSKERPHVYFTPDRLVQPALTDAERPLQMKCAWFRAAKEWRDRVPIAYQVQAQHELYVTAAEEGFFAVLLDGYRFAWYRVERHERFIKRLLVNIDEFWNRVQQGDPPAIDGSKSSLHAVFEMHPQHKMRAVELPDDLSAEAQYLWDEEAAKLAPLMRRKEELKARIQLLMGDALYAVLPDGSGFRWSRNGKSGRFERVEEVRLDDVAA